MKYRYFENSVFQKKAIFSSLLSAELRDCKYSINARYEWKGPSQILTFSMSQKKVIDIGINVNIGGRKYNRTIIANNELNLRYRAYYISTYIHCLENATSCAPQSYFSGLVLLCAINGLCKKGCVNAYSPIGKKLSELKPIDVYCAIRALTRLSIECGDAITGNLKNECSNIINNLLLYSMLPEIGYTKAKPMFSLLQEIRELQENISSQRCSLADYTLFSDFGIRDFADVRLHDMVILCERHQNPFLGNLVIRLSAHFGERLDSSLIEGMYFTSCIRHFKEDTVKYCLNAEKTTDSLVLNNFTVIKILLNKIEKVCITATENSGMLHYYQ